MKTLIRNAVPMMIMAAMSGAPLFAHAQSPQEQVQVQSQTQAQSHDETNAAEAKNLQGYRDGKEAAQLDKAAKRKIDAKSSHLYLHPPVKAAAREEYRSSFLVGYDAQLKNAGGA